MTLIMGSWMKTLENEARLSHPASIYTTFLVATPIMALSASFYERSNFTLHTMVQIVRRWSGGQRLFGKLARAGYCWILGNSHSHSHSHNHGAGCRHCYCYKQEYRGLVGFQGNHGEARVPERITRSHRLGSEFPGTVWSRNLSLASQR